MTDKQSETHREPPVEREGEALSPQAGRDIERPRGGPRAVLLGAALLLAVVIAAIVISGLV